MEQAVGQARPQGERPEAPDMARLIEAVPSDETEEVTVESVRFVRLRAPKRLPLHLTPSERRLLVVLRRHAGAVVSYQVLSRALWGPGFDAEGDVPVIQQHVSKLRAKLEPFPRSPRYIINYPGMGYALFPNGVEVPALGDQARLALGSGG